MEPASETPPAAPPAAKGRRPRLARLRKLRPLPLAVRIVCFLLGWLLVLIGVAGLVLPGIQGVFTIFIGAAVLSLVSELIYERLRDLLSRWPSLWRRIEGFRLKLHRRLRPRNKTKTPPSP